MLASEGGKCGWGWCKAELVMREVSVRGSVSMYRRRMCWVC